MSAKGWKSTFKQSDRNKEVREIANVLASLEPGANAGSKLRLAMQFEDTVFNSADSLEDYNKRLNKRLRKLQKNYVPTQKPGESEHARGIEALRQAHGEAILYVLKHASTGVREMKLRQGDEKAQQLKQHLDSAKMWAVDLGLLEKTKPNLNMSHEHLERLKSQIERRLENVRSHVVKLADPDQFFMETLEKAEEDCRGRGSKILAASTRKRYGQVHRTEMKAQELLQDSLKKATASVPLPTRNQRNDERAALFWLEKMRASSSATNAFMGVEDKQNIPKGTLPKLHSIVTEGHKFVMEVMINHRKQSKAPGISLQDAWMKNLQIRGEEDATAALDGPPTKKQKRTASVLQSKILFTPGRKTPPNLLQAFRMKEAKLVRPPPRGEGSHLVLHFGKAFVMTIFFVPLLVRLNAYDEKDDGKKEKSECAPWKPFSHGLTERKDLNVWGAKGDYSTLGEIVEERLRDASANATRVLRQIFATTTEKESLVDFEREILEGTALLEFLQLARTTYMIDWKDADP
jgi:hypothetical protein